MRCAFITFGCKVNQYDTQLLRERLAARGYAEVSPHEEADLYVVNTCAVTAQSERKARHQVHRLAREHPAARIVVTGCSVQRDRRAWSQVAGVSAVAGIGEAMLLFGDDRPGTVEGHGIQHFAGHTRAFLKVQEGCDAYCSYCIVPYVRGRSRSRPPKAVLEEARRLVDSGHREIVVTGIHVGLYGRDLVTGSTLVDLLCSMEKIPGLDRLRLSSIEIGEVTEELIAFAAESEKFCPHFHVPLQSGDDEVLKRMRRTYSAPDFLRTLEHVRATLDRPAVSSDAMVGFPGETDRAFANTVRVCREAGFSRLHVFPFSARPGTEAATLPDCVDPSTASEREAHLLELGRSLALEFKRQFIAQRVRVLVECRRDRQTGLLAGYCDRYMRCLLIGPDDWMNEIVQAKVAEATAEHLLVEPVGERENNRVGEPI